MGQVAPKDRPAKESGFFTPMPSIRKRSGHQWQKIRLRILARDCGLCQECRRKGHVTQGAEVDHIVPQAKGGTDDESNLQLLCVACHESKTRTDNGWRERVTIGLDGWPVAG